MIFDCITQIWVLPRFSLKPDHKGIMLNQAQLRFLSRFIANSDLNHEELDQIKALCEKRQKRIEFERNLERNLFDLDCDDRLPDLTEIVATLH